MPLYARTCLTAVMTNQLAGTGNTTGHTLENSPHHNSSCEMVLSKISTLYFLLILEYLHIHNDVSLGWNPSKHTIHLCFIDTLHTLPEGLFL